MTRADGSESLACRTCAARIRIVALCVPAHALKELLNFLRVQSKINPPKCLGQVKRTWSAGVFFSSVLFVWLVGCVFVVVVLFIVMRLKIPLICYRFCKFSAPVMRFSSDAFSPTSRFALFPGFCFDVTKVFFDITDRSPKALRRNACGSFLPRIIYYYYFKQFFKDFLIL